MVPSATTVKPAAAVPPKDTADAPVKFAPLMVMFAAPAVGPLVAATALTEGAEAAE